MFCLIGGEPAAIYIGMCVNVSECVFFLSFLSVQVSRAFILCQSSVFHGYLNTFKSGSLGLPICLTDAETQECNFFGYLNSGSPVTWID